MAQVIYLNKLLSISYEERQRNEAIQDQINSLRNTLANNTKNYSPFHKALAKISYKEYFLSKWKLISNEVTDD
jgi:hypothetical protein